MRWLLLVALLMGVSASSVGAGATPKPETRIVFTAATVFDQGRYEWQVYSARPSGAGLAQLTFGSEPASDPLPAPDGRLILFKRGKALWVMQSDGRRARRLVADASEPTWTPDSRRVAYVTGDGIRTIGVDGTGRRLLVPLARSPTWSADGQSMAYAEWYTDHDDVFVRRDGKEWPIGEAEGLEGLALSPDGRLVAVLTKKPATEIFRLDGRTYADLGVADQPRWSPDGRRLAFTREGRLHVMNVATRQVRALSRPHPVYSVTSFAWSPAGDEILYALGYKSWPAGSIEAVSLAGRVRRLPSTYPAGVGDVVAWSTVPTGGRLRPPMPLWTSSGNEFRLRQPVRSLAADGDRAAFITCSTLGAWRPAAAEVVPVRTEGVLCDYRDGLFLSDVALAGAYVGWASQQGGNTKVGWLTTAPISPNAPQTVVSAPRGHTSPDPRGNARSGHLVGDGPLLVFSEWGFCDDLNRPCISVPTVSNRRVLAESVWRVREPSWPEACPLGVSRPPYLLPVGRCQSLRVEPGPLVPLDVSDGRIVASGDNETVILDPEGREVGSIPVPTTSAQLAGNDLALLASGLLRVYDASTSAFLRSHGGVGDLQDVAAGLAAHVVEGRLHVLRLRDGEDVEIGPAIGARFGDSGLYYFYQGEYPWRGRIRFVPFERLPIHS